jgi:hypothetical protein
VAGVVESVVPTSGQNGLTFSFDQALTACFPGAAKPFEADMHGGFTEDPETGIVYTGIPGFGLCSVSPDLKTWSKLGTDERLKGNIHGIVMFTHQGQKLLAAAQNADSRVLVMTLDGAITDTLTIPIGDEFTYNEANSYYKQEGAEFACTDVTYLDDCLYIVTGNL